jgi:hypothetical protein
MEMIDVDARALLFVFVCTSIDGVHDKGRKVRSRNKGKEEEQASAPLGLGSQGNNTTSMEKRQESYLYGVQAHARRPNRPAKAL